MAMQISERDKKIYNIKNGLLGITIRGKAGKFKLEMIGGKTKIIGEMCQRGIQGCGFLTVNGGSMGGHHTAILLPYECFCNDSFLLNYNTPMENHINIK